MRSLVSCVVAISFALAIQPAVAQAPEDAYVRMQAAMADAQAQANRPGDEDLTCEQLEAEMIASTQDPAFQAYMVEAGAWSQAQRDAYNEARGRAQAQMAGNLFMGLASSFVPGLGYAQMAQQRAQAAEQQRQAADNMAQMMAMMERMVPIMPNMMRGQRVHELATAKQCPFVQQQPPQQQ